MAFEQLFDFMKTAIETVSKVSEGDNPLSQPLETVRLIFVKAKGMTEDIPRDGTDANSIWETIEPVFYFHDRISKVSSRVTLFAILTYLERSVSLAMPFYWTWHL